MHSLACCLTQFLSFCSLGDTESQAVLALPAEGWPVRSCGRIRLQRLPPQAVHAQRNLPHHIPACRWVELFLFQVQGCFLQCFLASSLLCLHRHQLQLPCEKLAYVKSACVCIGANYLSEIRVQTLAAPLSKQQGNGVAGHLALTTARSLSEHQGWREACVPFDLTFSSLALCQA